VYSHSHHRPIGKLIGTRSIVYGLKSLNGYPAITVGNLVTLIGQSSRTLTMTFAIQFPVRSDNMRNLNVLVPVV
jgi:hypothetical protein